jgi:hypothetical protein
MLIVVDSDISYNSFLEIGSKINIVETNISNNEIKIKGYFVANLPRTINENVFKWWALKNDGYVNDIRNARIFLQNDIEELFNKYEKPEWNEYEYKKLVAIPVGSVLGIGSNIIPYIAEYINVFKKLNEITIGNKKLSLTKEEVKNYG